MKRILAAIVMFGFAHAATALVASCPIGTVYPAQRTISIDTAHQAACYAFGTGNLPSSSNIDFSTYVGPPGTITGPSPVPAGLWLWQGTFDASSGASTGTGGAWASGGSASGSWSFDASLWGSFNEILILLKTGTGQYDPDWAAFSLAGSDSTGTYSVVPTLAGGLSHFSVFGRCTLPGGCNSVPEPGTLALLGLGLAGLGFGLRRRRPT